jgi:small GTP-binding protein|uniref:GTP-binding protein n=1 Tax=viral metagenome TaxID=1070528 RepID=A0A6C0IRM0_9ZZZZ
MSYNYLLKLIVTGEQNSGKTSLVHRISDNEFRQYMDATIGVEFVAIQREIKDKVIKYHFWDTAGQENFAPIIKNYYKGVASGFLVIDATDTEWKNHMEKWLKRYNAHKFEESLPLIAILNKIDLERKVSFEEFKLFADENGMKSYEISVKTGANTKYLLDKMTEYILEHIEKGSKLPGVKKGIDIRQIEEKFQPEQGLYDKCCIVQ